MAAGHQIREEGIMPTATEFKHGLRLQLLDVKKLLEYLHNDDPRVDAAVRKLHEMEQVLMESLQD
ncbi:MAG: hypothetical protein IJ682_11020 [Lachnospiraceae bacterium]|nr:hypothetical protein [Lachnospiraceae bacterium]